MVLGSEMGDLDVCEGGELEGGCVWGEGGGGVRWWDPRERCVRGRGGGGAERCELGVGGEEGGGPRGVNWGWVEGSWAVPPPPCPFNDCGANPAPHTLLPPPHRLLGMRRLSACAMMRAFLGFMPALRAARRTRSGQ